MTEKQMGREEAISDAVLLVVKHKNRIDEQIRFKDRQGDPDNEIPNLQRIADLYQNLENEIQRLRQVDTADGGSNDH